MTKKTMIITLLTSLLGFTNLQADDTVAQPFQSKALEILRFSVSMRTAKGFGLVPKLAAYYKDQFLHAGFKQEDIYLLPMAKTAALVVRYRGDGSAGKKPILLSTHMDVVDAKPQDWERDPFKLVESDGYYFGRGSSDDKFGVAVLSATLMRLKAEGFVPARDIILVVSGDEETDMMTIHQLATQYLKLIDAEYALIADGGGGHLNEAGHATAFSVDIAEKTYASFDMTARNPGGHSSLPRKDNAILDLTRALTKIFNYDFPVEKNALTRAYFSKTAALVGGRVGAAMRQFADHPEDQGAVSVLKEFPEYRGTISTTCVPTMLRGGHAENALPQSATATVNCRIFPGNSIQDTLDTLKKVVANDAIEWQVLGTPLASDVSPIREDVFEAVTHAVDASYPGLPIIPSMALGGSDGIYLRAAGIPSYVFSGIFMKASDEFAHGKNERVPVATLPVAMKMWYSILKTLAG